MHRGRRGLRRVILTAAVLLALPSCKRKADPVGEVDESVGRFVRASGKTWVYVTNEDAGNVAIIDADTDTVVGAIAVGQRPRGLRVSRDGRLLYVAVSGSPKAPPGVDESTLRPPDRRADGIAVVSLEARRVVRVLESGTDPEAFALSPDERRMYVSNEDAAQASVLDVATGKVLARLDVGREPEGVTTSPDGAFVYVTSEVDHSVAVIDTAVGEVVASVATSTRPRSVVFTPDGSRAFVSAELGAAITVIDARTHTRVTDIPIAAPGARPMGLALSADASTLFVSNGRGRSLAVVDVASESMRQVIADVGARPWGVALTPDGMKLYTANGPSHDVSVVEVASGKVIKRIKVAGSPWGVAVGGT